MPGVKKLGDMTAAELENHIRDVDESHRSRMRRLRALQRCVQDQEVSREEGQKPLFDSEEKS